MMGEYGKGTLALGEDCAEGVAVCGCGERVGMVFAKLRFVRGEATGVREDGDVLELALDEAGEMVLREGLREYARGVNDFRVVVGDVGVWFW